jgi:hypothetical protein
MSSSVHRALRTTLATTISAVSLMALPLLISVASAETVCPNAAMRTGASANLPDCRAYELVTPVEKNGGEATVEEFGDTGESALISSRATLSPGTTDDLDGGYSFYTLTRTGDGWTPTSIVPSATEYEGPYHGFSLVEPYLKGVSADGSSTLWESRRRSDPEPERRVDSLYLQRTPGGPLVEVGPMAPPSWASPPGTLPAATNEELGSTTVLSYSRDLSHVLLAGLGALNYPDEPLREELRARDQWSTETAEGDPTLYEYADTGNSAPLQVGVGNDNKIISECGTVLGAAGFLTEHLKGNPDAYGDADNPISADGSTVFFIARAYGVEGTAYGLAKPCSSALVVNELYARIDNGEPGAHTVAISQPSQADCHACDTEPGVREPAYFQGASEDGSKVFFTTDQPLLGEDTSRNIYEYDFDAREGERIVRVSGGDSTVSTPDADVKGVAAISQDGSHVYFVAGGVLTVTPNSRGQEAIQGADNLYVFDTETRGTSFIGDLCSGKIGERERSGSVTDANCPTEIQKSIINNREEEEPGEDSRIWGGRPVFSNQEEGEETPRKVDATPDGRFLVFTSYADLTADDTSRGAVQAFEYDAQTGILTRVSIGQNGFGDDGNSDNPYLGASIVSPSLKLGNVGILGVSTGRNRMTVSADGSYVFFVSADGLTPQALNGAVLGYNDCNGSGGCPREPLYAYNVYEYHDGSVYLISDGKDVNFSATTLPSVSLLGTDSSGSDVFFTTADSLVPEDTNGGTDTYDARIDGGFPLPEVRPQCAGDECQGQLAGAPVLLSPGSEFQAGGSNFKPVVSAPVKTKAKQMPRRKVRKRPRRKGKKRGKAGAVRRAGTRAEKSARRSEGRGK